ncbi:hypothetical protein ACFQY7_05130 [Actinomadura luteofluorescens]|uniref:Uncharacterized protein n=1 Tax=Actinomadura luteofluorescens TaxID=46163 RepID=A0A7Y9EBK2_9ACTN|nr:hypothetical protein [Actinomadura luteofluorescens]NYD44773.1 hypothetical protein [Actinomadura luteofluorescens]
MTVCRECCCGRPEVTGVDHDDQPARLCEAGAVRVSRCLNV